jgi:DHA1 family tetracycline resistance protein-like MFS transporter
MSRTYVNFWRLAPCLFAIIVDYMGLGLVYPIVAEMFTEVPDSVFPNVQSATSRDFYMGLAYVLYPLFMFFGASFLGDLSDNFGRK